MQSGLEGKFKARYALKFSVKMSNNATEMYFQLLMDQIVYVKHLFFRWHKRFKNGKQEARDDDTWEREVHKKLVLFEKICNFLAEDRRRYIKTWHGHCMPNYI